MEKILFKLGSDPAVPEFLLFGIAITLIVIPILMPSSVVSTTVLTEGSSLDELNIITAKLGQKIASLQKQLTWHSEGDLTKFQELETGLKAFSKLHSSFQKRLKLDSINSDELRIQVEQLEAEFERLSTDVGIHFPMPADFPANSFLNELKDLLFSLLTENFSTFDCGVICVGILVYLGATLAPKNFFLVVLNFLKKLLKYF